MNALLLSSLLVFSSFENNKFLQSPTNYSSNELLYSNFNTNITDDIDIKLTIDTYQAINNLHECTIEINFKNTPKQRSDVAIMLVPSTTNFYLDLYKPDGKQDHFITDTTLSYNKEVFKTNYNGSNKKPISNTFEEIRYTSQLRGDSNYPYVVVNLPKDTKVGCEFNGGSRPTKYNHTQYTNFKIVSKFRVLQMDDNKIVRFNASLIQAKTKYKFDYSDISISFIQDDHPISVSISLPKKEKYLDVVSVISETKKIDF